MRDPRFWWRAESMAGSLLHPIGLIYGLAAGARIGRPGQRVGVPVICVGNLTLGGAGKTPTALYVARGLAACGAQPVFLTRGYGGALAGPVRVDPTHHDARAVGDEPLLLARAAPTIVARDRVAGAVAACAAGADV
ncbi:MAG: tetraacyldisaccharide 4'-kinase, partial [Proteobacteria bacterium]|nr:tetraacyldisaccharide 4'-kinase [Pseudomonadota bacterium]